jgi:hypothetical protein
MAPNLQDTLCKIKELARQFLPSYHRPNKNTKRYYEIYLVLLQVGTSVKSKVVSVLN